MRNIDVLMHLMYHALCDYSSKYGRASVAKGWFTSVEHNKAEISFFPYNRVYRVCASDFRVEAMPNTIDEYPDLVHLLNNGPFTIIYYAPDVVKSLIDNADDVTSKASADFGFVKYTLTYHKCYGDIFVYKDNPVPYVCIITKELSAELHKIVEPSMYEIKQVRVNRGGNFLVGGAAGGYWVIGGNSIPQSLDGEYGDVSTDIELPRKNSCNCNVDNTKNGMKEHIRKLLLNQGTVRDRYDRLCRALSSIDSELPDKLDVILEVMEE